MVLHKIRICSYMHVYCASPWKVICTYTYTSLHVDPCVRISKKSWYIINCMHSVVGMQLRCPDKFSLYQDASMYILGFVSINENVSERPDWHSRN